MARQRISDAATTTLEHWLDEFMQGQLSFGELPLAVEAYLHVGFALGRQSCQPEITRLQREANYLHYLLVPERERRADIEERLAARLADMSFDDLDGLDYLLQHIAAHNSEDATPVAGAEHHASRTRKAA